MRSKNECLLDFGTFCQNCIPKEDRNKTNEISHICEKISESWASVTYKNSVTVNLLIHDFI